MNRRTIFDATRRTALVSVVTLISALPGPAPATAQGREFTQPPPQQTTGARKRAQILQRMVQVPDLRKHTVQEAQMILQDVPLVLGPPQMIGQTRGGKAVIVRQSPEPGARVFARTQVAIWVEEEPQPPPPPPTPGEVKVPDLVSHNQLEALVMLAHPGLRLGAVTRVPSAQAKPGTIIAQEPAAGRLVERGTPVAISVATVVMATVPDLYHHTRENAVAMLQSSGLQAGTIGQAPSAEQPGLVLRQSVPANTQVPPGTPVNFDVSEQVQLTLTASPRRVITPGDSVTFRAELEPSLPGAEFQFKFGDGSVRDWSPDPLAAKTYANDGSFDAAVTARWDGGSLEGQTTIQVHAIDYQVRLIPSPGTAKPGEPVNFDVDITPDAKNVTYTFDFGDGTASYKSTTLPVTHSYAQADRYFPRVTAHIIDSQPAEGKPDEHDFESRRVMLAVLLPPPPPPPTVPTWLIVAGAAALLAGAGYSARKLFQPRVVVRVHTDLGEQRVERSRRAWNFEIHAVRSWGEQTIHSGGPGQARSEKRS